ncbi:MlaD family protein [Nocardia sp. NPDC003345]
MTTPRAAAVRLLLLLVVVVLIVILVVQAIRRPVDGETLTYRADFGDVFGLQTDADVRLRGVQVGKVTGIGITAQFRAEVGFTLQERYRLRDTDRLAVKMQNLTGQRYLELVRGADTGTYLDPGDPVTGTVDSFDITVVFNGLRPLLRDADPEVYNRLARNLVAVIEGDGDDIAPLLADIAELSGYAADRTAVLSAIVHNLHTLSGQLRGRSGNLENILRVFHSIFMPVATRMAEFLSLMEKGSVEMTEVVRTADALSRLLLGAVDSQDHLTERIRQAIPDSAAAVRSLSVLPGLLESLNALIPSTDPARQCSAGALPVPVEAEVLVAGRPVTVCRTGR